MKSSPCSHGVILPKGIRCDRGYIQAYIMRHGRRWIRSFGPHDADAVERAQMAYWEKKKAIREGRDNIKPAPKPMKFEQARLIFLERHYVSYRDPNTHQPRSEGSISSAKYLLCALGEQFDGYTLEEVFRVPVLVKLKEELLVKQELSPASFNKYRMLLSSMYDRLKEWTALELIEPVKLPPENPCEFIPQLQENKRSRIPDAWDLANAYGWCQGHDPELWTAIEQALLTALRRQDLKALDSLTVAGKQKKTGEDFKLPLKLDKPANWTNFNRRWNALRAAMGWLPGGEGVQANPRHTTWHDLRHWAPTFLAEKGTPTKLIQSYTGHKKEETLNRYTNVRASALEPLVNQVKEEIERIKRG